MSLPELLVSVGLIVAMLTALVLIYGAARAEYEHASGTMTLSEHARMLSDKVAPLVASAVGGRSNGDAFYHPDGNSQLGTEMYEVDFISSFNFLPDPGGNSDFERPNPIYPQVPDPRSAGAAAGTALSVIQLPSGTVSNTTVPASYDPAFRFRYRIAWTRTGDTGRNIPARGVYLERLQTNPDNGNASDSGTRNTNIAPRLLMRDVSFCSFTRETGAIQMRVKLYNIDNENLDANGQARVMDGELMRGQTNQQRTRSFELYSTLQIPAVTMNPTN